MRRGAWDILEDDVMLFKNNSYLFFVRTRQGKFLERWRSSSLFIAINAWFVYSEGEIVFLVSSYEMEETSSKYILLRDRVGNSVEKNMMALGLTMKSTPIQVLRGEVLEGVPEAEQPTDSTKVAVVGIERKSLRLECRTEYMARLSEEDTNLLLAITSAEGRYLTYLDRKHLTFGRQLLPGSAVFVEVKGVSKVLPGVVWYKGVLPPSLGTWFGVELIVSTRALVKSCCWMKLST